MVGASTPVTGSGGEIFHPRGFVLHWRRARSRCVHSEYLGDTGDGSCASQVAGLAQQNVAYLVEGSYALRKVEDEGSVVLADAAALDLDDRFQRGESRSRFRFGLAVLGHDSSGPRATDTGRRR